MTEIVIRPKTETVLMVLAGFALMVTFKRLPWMRLALPWIVRGVFNRTFNVARPPTEQTVGDLQ